MVSTDRTDGRQDDRCQPNRFTSQRRNIEMERPRKGVPQYLSHGDMPDRKLWVPHTDWWVPVYLEGYGSASRVHLADGRAAYFGWSAVRILDEVARYYAIDRVAMRNLYRDLIIKSQWPPLLVAARDTVFFAIKTRQPDTKNGGATGYVSESAIAGMELWNGRYTRLILHSGDTIEVLESRQCVMARRGNALWLKRELMQQGIIPQR